MLIKDNYIHSLQIDISMDIFEEKYPKYGIFRKIDKQEFRISNRIVDVNPITIAMGAGIVNIPSLIDAIIIGLDRYAIERAKMIESVVYIQPLDLKGDIIPCIEPEIMTFVSMVKMSSDTTEFEIDTHMKGE